MAIKRKQRQDNICMAEDIETVDLYKNVKKQTLHIFDCSWMPGEAKEVSSDLLQEKKFKMAVELGILVKVTE